MNYPKTTKELSDCFRKLADEIDKIDKFNNGESKNIVADQFEIGFFYSNYIFKDKPTGLIINIDLKTVNI